MEWASASAVLLVGDVMSGTTSYYATSYQSPIGRLTAACDGQSLVGLWVEGQKYFADTVAGTWVWNDERPVLVALRGWLDRYFAGERPAPAELLLAPRGNRFRQAVWSRLLAIPYGQVTTYGALARAVAADLGRATMSAQAVGGAVGHNPISLVIPCHRVVGANRRLTGYAGGLTAKRRLLELEGFDLTDWA